MEIKRGIPVSPGVAIGPALVLDTDWYRIPQRFVAAAAKQEEVDRLQRALTAAADEANANQRTVSDKLGPQYGAIFAAHHLLIQDPALGQEIVNLIRTNGYAAEYAVS